MSEILALSLIIIASITLFRFSSELYYDEGKLIFTVIYVSLPFGFALGLPKFYDGTFTWEVFLLFVLIWSSDSFAYFTSTGSVSSKSLFVDFYSHGKKSYRENSMALMSKINAYTNESITNYPTESYIPTDYSQNNLITF